MDFAAERTQREQALAEQMKRMEEEQARMQEQRRAELAAAAAAAASAAPTAGGPGGRGRGRGVSLLPAWATKASAAPAPGGLASTAAAPVAPGGDGMTAAERMMAKMGHVPGQGLGKHGTGITSALEHQKTGQNTGVIVQSGASDEPVGPAVRGTPSCVLLLRNLVAPGAVDESLKPDILQECSKYAPALNCVVLELSAAEQRQLGVRDTGAVRVFVEFESPTGAAAAGGAMHGRSFGGRIVDACFFPDARYSSMQLMPQRGDD